MKKLSVVLATLNEETNIGLCLQSVKTIADEIIVVDEYSTDKTIEIAKKYGAKVYEEPHHDIFHITKQRALDRATRDWILQLDADERVTPELAREIKTIIRMTDSEMRDFQKLQKSKHSKLQRLFARHQKLIEQSGSSISSKSSQIVAFFIPRVNFFLRKPLIHAGVYPDGVIRLVKKGKARFPQKSVHEQMTIDGQVGWLFNNLEHHDSPTLSRYLKRMNRYTDLKAQELQNSKTPRNLLYLLIYSSIKPLLVFLNLYFRHKGFLDGLHGFLWSFLSALHYPIAYFKFWKGNLAYNSK